MHHFVAIGEFKLELQSRTHNSALNRWFFVQCDLEIWQMTLKSNRVPFLTYCKLCSRWWIQSRVTVRKRPIQAKIAVFFPCNLEIKQMTSKPMWHFFSATSSDVHYFIAICESKLKLCSGKSPYWGNICFDPCDLDLWPLTMTLSQDITFVNGNDSWKLRWEVRFEKGVTDARRADRRTEVFLEPLGRS